MRKTGTVLYQWHQVSNDAVITNALAHQRIESCPFCTICIFTIEVVQVRKNTTTRHLVFDFNPLPCIGLSSWPALHLVVLPGPQAAASLSIETHSHIHNRGAVFTHYTV